MLFINVMEDFAVSVRITASVGAYESGATNNTADVRTVQ